MMGVHSTEMKSFDVRLTEGHVISGLFAFATDVFFVLEKSVSPRGLSVFHVFRYTSLIGLTIS